MDITSKKETEARIERLAHYPAFGRIRKCDWPVKASNEG